LDCNFCCWRYRLWQTTHCKALLTITMFTDIKVMLYCYNSSWVLAIQTSWLSLLCCFQKCDWNSECRFCIMVCNSNFTQIIMYLSTPPCQERMKLLGSHGSFWLPFVMKVMVWCFSWATFSHGYDCTSCYVYLESVYCGDFSAINLR
jgi:hypothetical protein